MTYLSCSRDSNASPQSSLNGPHQSKILDCIPSTLASLRSNNLGSLIPRLIQLGGPGDFRVSRSRSCWRNMNQNLTLNFKRKLAGVRTPQQLRRHESMWRCWVLKRLRAALRPRSLHSTCCGQKALQCFATVDWLQDLAESCIP